MVMDWLRKPSAPATRQARRPRLDRRDADPWPCQVCGAQAPAMLFPDHCTECEPEARG